MTKSTFLACAALLTSAVALNSCKSDDLINGPQEQAEVVKTEFAISLPSNVAGGPNKMPSGTVQTTPAEFNGIDSIILVPFAKAGAITKDDVRLGKNIALIGDIAASGAGSLGTKSNAKVFTDVAVPLTTASFLFYAQSAKSTGDKFENGSLKVDTASTHDTPAGFSFNLDSLITTSALAALTTSGVGKDLLDILTAVATASDNETERPAKRWYEYPETGDSVAMYKMFKTFTSMHGLSSFEVARVLTDLYKSLTPRRATSKIADGILDVIDAKSPTYLSVDGDGVVTMVSAYNEFPQGASPKGANLPVGSIDIVWDSENHIFKQGTYASQTNPTKFVYPANLWYTANSTIKTSNTSKRTMYNNENTWATITAAHTDGTAVNSKTRAIVLQDSVQYAVARLDLKVQLADDNLPDNSETVEGSATPVDCSGGLPVTGVFVGGQNHVGFDFTPAAAGTYTIYDRHMAASGEAMKAKNGSFSAVNHTLVLESYAGSDVRVAVELENTTGQDFYGYGNQLIPKGGKFYVVAVLSAAAAVTETGSRVFKQDFTTKANLTLTTLQKAYNDIPDLRTPELEIGFAVSLTWQNGHSYTINFEE